MLKSVAIIGSFKQHYREILADWQTFTAAGLIITSPKGTPIIEPGIEFVRFITDDPAATDAQVQQIALHRILHADFVYAELPGGYVGHTVCMEIGRILSANRPIYFSNYPKDLPLEIPASHIVSAQKLMSRLQTEAPSTLLDTFTGKSRQLEQGLVDRKYQDV